MEILRYERETADELIKRSQADINEILNIVQDILSDVKENKDEAVKRYTAKFDRCELDDLQVSDEEIKNAYDNLDTDLIDALKRASQNIEKFHKAQIPEEWSMEVAKGITAGQIIRPINSVGCYIPGGRAAYPSSILMEVIPAKIAGVERIICCTPPGADGRILDAILVAADLAGADEIYKCGGAQAIAAMAFGTESIQKVEKIVGPGNVFVTGAKKLVYGDVDIEFPAGPSEVLILADKTAIPEYLAHDFLSQAEHDPEASCFLVTDDEKIAEESNDLIERFTKEAVRKEIIQESLEKHGHIILCKDMEEAIEFTNTYAPEHLIISTEDDNAILDKIKNAGSIFLGKYSPVAAGDYGSGTNHVLPTSGGAKMYSGLSTESFIKKPTVQTITKEGIEELSKTVIPIAEYEGFYAHANSVKVRLDKNE
ncbi:histidinol dehydrogenase HisD [Methanobrevibacter ruminantium M1]|uniref:Histidinol dehydrogenase n=1 Tax=Methanobrevibacter ruminantium (strain ATCC 35063 / DSM 1093 / JCM 13430 / OCM 146 / M1) TaxID=634498 RepID=D3E2V5_METRM|nr:histidinol dehydrogenase [Methanobrevibacter ruminantium]ADC46866.1 histidinol dehydrogenase HisD [Methanobrevibacter ruminantium M1]